MTLLPALPLLILLAGVLLEILLGRLLTTRGKGWLAFACGLGALAGVLVMLPAAAHGQVFQSLLFTWDRNIPFLLYADALGLLFALMGTGIGSAILFYCIDYMAHETGGVTRFYILMLVFIAGLVSLVFSANLLMIYLSWEVIGLCSYFLVGFWYQETAAANGARKVLLMTHLPGYALLIAILLLYHNSGTLLWTDPALAAHFTSGIFLLMLVAAMAKSVMFPLHTWIPEAMNAPTPVSALLHSACYVKAGIYLIARMVSFNGGQPWSPNWSLLVMAIGCVTMLVGALFALAQTDLKRLLAYSTISQLGYIVAAMGMGPVYGMYAAMFYTVSHGLFKGTLFLCAGAVQHAAGTRDMRRLGGLAQRMPNTARIWLIAAAAIIGVPLTNGFFAKWLLFDAALKQGFWVVAATAWLVSILTAFYIL
ncbi:MAG TPA: NADH-quinone oxidoreductase subunit L, partial [Anaerolineaceae bacterium]